MDLKKLRLHNITKADKIVLSSGLGFLILCIIVKFSGLHVNIEQSLAPGIYYLTKKTEIKQYDVVSFLPGAALTELVLELGYDTYTSVKTSLRMKIIRGLPGDHVIIDEKGVTINGQTIKNSKQLKQDGLGQPLPQLRINRTLKPDEYIIMSENTYRGFDSRYYGPVKKEIFKKVGKKIISFNWIKRDPEPQY